MTVKNALTQVRLQGASAEIKSATVQCFKTIMVDRAGFEPALRLTDFWGSLISWLIV
jgi:hypothetical protein